MICNNSGYLARANIKDDPKKQKDHSKSKLFENQPYITSQPMKLDCFLLGDDAIESKLKYEAKNTMLWREIHFIFHYWYINKIRVRNLTSKFSVD